MKRIFIFFTLFTAVLLVFASCSKKEGGDPETTEAYSGVAEVGTVAEPAAAEVFSSYEAVTSEDFSYYTGDVQVEFYPKLDEALDYDDVKYDEVKEETDDGLKADAYYSDGVLVKKDIYDANGEISSTAIPQEDGSIWYYSYDEENEIVYIDVYKNDVKTDRFMYDYENGVIASASQQVLDSEGAIQSLDAYIFDPAGNVVAHYDYQGLMELIVKGLANSFNNGLADSPLGGIFSGLGGGQ